MDKMYCVSKITELHDIIYISDVTADLAFLLCKYKCKPTVWDLNNLLDYGNLTLDKDTNNNFLIILDLSVRCSLSLLHINYIRVKKIKEIL
jgi:hypothetical protein